MATVEVKGLADGEAMTEEPGRGTGMIGINDDAGVGVDTIAELGGEGMGTMTVFDGGSEVLGMVTVTMTETVVVPLIVLSCPGTDCTGDVVGCGVAITLLASGGCGAADVGAEAEGSIWVPEPEGETITEETDVDEAPGGGTTTTREELGGGGYMTMPDGPTIGTMGYAEVDTEPDDEYVSSGELGSGE